MNTDTITNRDRESALAKALGIDPARHPDPTAEDRCDSCGRVFADLDDEEPDYGLAETCDVSLCLVCTDCCGHEQEVIW